MKLNDIDLFVASEGELNKLRIVMNALLSGHTVKIGDNKCSETKMSTEWKNSVGIEAKNKRKESYD